MPKRKRVSAPAPRPLWIAFDGEGDHSKFLAIEKTAKLVFDEAWKKRPKTIFIRQMTKDDEIPNDELLAAMKEAEEMDRQGKLKSYSTVEEFMASLAG